MKRRIGGIDLRVWMVGAALLLDLIVFRAQIVESIGSVACLERANFEMILCAAPPAEWQILLSGGLALALSISLGALLASRPRRTA
jgi:hypothetical protein